MRFAIVCFVCAAGSAQSLWFEPNQGQAHPSVEFLAHASKGYAYFAPDKMAVRDVRMELIGTNKGAQAQLEDPLGGISSYFIGRNEKDWHTGIPHYGRIRYKNVYAGIDLVYYASGRDIEYDFVLKPGADPNQIKLAYNKPVRIDENGDLLIAGLKQHRPKVLQSGREIECDYLVRDHRVQLALAEYDRSVPLTVDPVLEFSTNLGGVAEESGDAIALDSTGNVYLAGGSQAPAAPELNPFQQTTALIASPVVFKMTPDGHRILYYAYIGNGSWDHTLGVGVDASGSAVITGQTRNPNFPLKNAFQTTFKAIWDNAFITRLSPDGKSLIYSSYFGGSNYEGPGRLALDSQGNAFITGQTGSKDFPIVNAFQPAYGGGTADCYLAKISPSGAPLWSTYLGGSGSDWCYAVAVDPQGNAYMAGASNSTDIILKNALQTTITPRGGFVTPLLAKFAPDGSLLASTFLGGPVAGDAETVALDLAGNVYIGGYADPRLVTKNAFQPNSSAPISGYFMEVDSSLQNTIFATYFGGSTGDSVRSIALDKSGSIYVLGSATSPDFPVKGSFQPFIGGGVCQCDIFVAKFPPGVQSLVYSTILGGHNGEFPGQIVVDSSNNAYIVGSTLSQDFPTKNAFQPSFGGAQDFVFFKISDNTPLAPSPLKPNPSHLSFRFTQGGATPAAQTVTVSGPAFTASTSVPWLTARPNGPTVTVSADPSGLAPNTYTASVNLIPTGDTPASIDITLIVLSPAPVLTSVDPALVSIGSGMTTITIHGSGFTKNSVVLVSGVPYTPVSFVDASTLRITLPENYFTVEYNNTIAVKNPTSDLSNVLSVAVGTPPPQFAVLGVVNAASFTPGPVAPGEIVTIFGTNLTGSVTFDNIPATLVFASQTQVNVTVPYAVTAPATSIQVGSSVPMKLDVAPSAPGIFAVVPAGGNILTLYATGCGPLTNDDLPRCALKVSATVNDQPATVLYAGIAPGLVQGANQINIQLPDGITSSQLTIVLTVGDASSKPFVWSQP